MICKGEAFLQNIAYGMKEAMKKINTCGLPKITKISSQKTETETQTNVRLMCEVDMQCMVSHINWFRKLSNGSSVPLEKEKYSEYPYSLQMENVLASDSGTYNCVAGNVLGTTTASIRLEINRANRANNWFIILAIVILIC